MRPAPMIGLDRLFLASSSFVSAYAAERARGIRGRPFLESPRGDLAVEPSPALKDALRALIDEVLSTATAFRAAGVDLPRRRPSEPQ